MTYGYGDVPPRCWCGQDWILPRRIVVAILAVSLLLLLVGVVLLAVGLSVGGVLVGLGGCGLLMLLLLGIHAFCCRYTKEVFTQTGVQVEVMTDDIPNYAVIQKPSSLKRSDSGAKRNGRTLEKHVTLAPDIEARERAGQVTVAPSSGTIQMEAVRQIPVQHSNQSQIYSQQNNFAQQTPIYKPSGQIYAPSGQMNRHVGQAYAPPVSQYPMQVYPLKTTSSSTSSSIRYGFDDDYDNPAETTPMLNQQSPQFSSGISSGMSGMSSGMQSGMSSGMQSGMSSGMQSGMSSGMQSGMSSGMSSGMPSGMSSGSYNSQFRSSSSQQSTVISCKGGPRPQEFDLPEPQPLQYPSAKRPMTFEQTSSSKMSVYDNLAGGLPETGVA